MRRSKTCVSPVACAILGSLLLAVPAQAAGPAERTNESPRSSIATLSRTTLARLQQAPAQDPATNEPHADSGSFFKSRKGAAVIVLIGAGFGYTLYSKNHDRVLSAVR